MRAKLVRSLLPALLLLGAVLAASTPGRTNTPAPIQQAATAARSPLARAVTAAAALTRSSPHPWASPSMPLPTQAAAARSQPIQPARTLPPTPAPRLLATLPPRAQVKDIYGYGQLLALSCESRSAADWARHFGVTIHELDFFQKLPKSKNPEEGFVGDPNGGWGNIPPGPYGVHAGPVAKLLKQYGLQAKAERNMPLNDLKAEIAAGRPVIVWVTGHVEPGKGQPYEVEAGKTVTVARYEHTVIVTGYDEKQVAILDGKTVYQRPVETFLKSWGALENMAVVWDPHAAPSPRCDPMGRC